MVSRDQTPQGQFYCSVGAKNAFGREMIDTLTLWQVLTLKVSTEVAAGQWEFNVLLKELNKQVMR